MSIMSRDRTRRLCLDAMLLCVALMLSYIESMLPTLLPLPGFRLGLANFAVTVAFCLYTPIDAAIISFMRISIMGILFGSVTSLWFSFLGGLLAFFMLLLLSKAGNRMSFVGVSVLCAVAHNIGQLTAAAVLFGSSVILSYLPYLLFAAAVFGSVVGVLLDLCVPRLQKLFEGSRT